MKTLQTVNWQEIAKRGCFVYAYLREHDRSPYYIGIASQWKRPFQPHFCELPAYDALTVVMRSGLTWEQACDWEQFYIKRYGRKLLGGLLQNVNPGGEGAPDPERTAARLGLSVDLIQTVSRSALNRINKRYAQGLRGADLTKGLCADFQSFEADNSNRGQKKAEAAAARFGLTLEEWNSYTRNEKRKAADRLKNGTATAENALDRQCMKQGSTRPQAIMSSASKYEVCPAIWFCCTPTERGRIRKRFKDGVRGLDLLAPKRYT